MKLLCPILLFFSLALAGAAARAQERDPIAHGRALAVSLCGPCHAIGARRHGPHRDAPPLRTIGRTYDLDQFARVLSAGLLPTHPDMPQFKFKIEDASDLAAYLRAIQE
jgi:mono/diheme cytochrome c family protein